MNLSLLKIFDLLSSVCIQSISHESTMQTYQALCYQGRWLHLQYLHWRFKQVWRISESKSGSKESGHRYSHRDGNGNMCKVGIITCSRRSCTIKEITTPVQDIPVWKVQCALFLNLHSLPFLPLSPLECKFKNKTGTEPFILEYLAPLYCRGSVLFYCHGSVLYYGCFCIVEQIGIKDRMSFVWPFNCVLLCGL